MRNISINDKDLWTSYNAKYMGNQILIIQRLKSMKQKFPELEQLVY